MDFANFSINLISISKFNILCLPSRRNQLMCTATPTHIVEKWKPPRIWLRNIERLTHPERFEEPQQPRQPTRPNIQEQNNVPRTQSDNSENINHIDKNVVYDLLTTGVKGNILGGDMA